MRLRETQGIATLEAAGFLIGILILFISGVFIVQYTKEFNQVSYYTDKYIYDTATVPFVINTSSTAINLIEVNRGKIEVFLNNAVVEVENELINNKDMAQGDFYIEASYAVVDIDPANGHSLGVSETWSSTKGGLALTSDIDNKTDLIEEFNTLSNKVKEDGSALIAIPSANFASAGTSNYIYLEKSVIIGMRVIWYLGDDFLSSPIQYITDQPYAYSVKTIPLRGEVKVQ